MSDKPTAQEGIVALTFTHSILYNTHTHTQEKQSSFFWIWLSLIRTLTPLHDGAWQRTIDCLYLAWQAIHNFSLREA